MSQTERNTNWDQFKSQHESRVPKSIQAGILNVAPEAPSVPDPAEGGMEELHKRYRVTPEQIAQFQQRRYIRLKEVVPPSVLAAVRHKIIDLVRPAFKGKNPSDPSESTTVQLRRLRAEQSTADDQDMEEGAAGEVASMWQAISEPVCQSWHLQMMWAINPVIRQVVLSPRIAGIVCDLLGCSNVRLYHDNTLSKVAGCAPTLWHCDDGPQGYMAMGSRRVVTVWIPLQPTPPSMGALTFATPSSDGSRMNAWDIAQLEHCPKDEKSPEYSQFVAKALEESGAGVDAEHYDFGDISIHATDCFHCACPNTTTTTRMILASTYFDDGACMREDMDKSTLPAGVLKDWGKFAPGVEPGDKIATKFNPVLPLPVDN